MYRCKDEGHEQYPGQVEGLIDVHNWLFRFHFVALRIIIFNNQFVKIAFLSEVPQKSCKKKKKMGEVPG